MFASLDIPQHNISIAAGDVVKLSKYSDISWVVGYGWYSYQSSAATCGWYLMQMNNPGIMKPLETTDLP